MTTPATTPSDKNVKSSKANGIAKATERPKSPLQPKRKSNRVASLPKKHNANKVIELVFSDEDEDT